MKNESGLLKLDVVSSAKASEELSTSGARLPIDDTLRDEYGRPLTRYEREKAIGIRRPNGALKLKKLSARQMKMIQLHLAGWSGGAIAVQMNCSQISVSRVLNDPLGKAVISRAMEDTKGEIQALINKSVGVVREGLEEEKPISTKFTAIDKLQKLQQMTGTETEGKTAEDLISDLLAAGTSFELTVSNKKPNQEIDITPAIEQDN